MKEVRSDASWGGPSVAIPRRLGVTFGAPLPRPSIVTLRVLSQAKSEHVLIFADRWPHGCSKKKKKIEILRDFYFREEFYF